MATGRRWTGAGALLLAAAPLAAQVPAMPAALPAASSATRLDISVTGEVGRVPDVATIGAGVVTQAPTAAAAMAANARSMTAAIAALRRAGVADRDIRTSALGLQPQYRYGENQPPVLTGYQASNQLSVTFRDLARSGAILDALVAQGINQISGPDFAVDKPEAALDEARAQAIATARARAGLYARAAGLRVKRIVAVRETGGDAVPPRPVPMMMAARADKAATPVAAGEQKLGVALEVSFELE